MLCRKYRKVAKGNGALLRTANNPGLRAGIELCLATAPQNKGEDKTYRSSYAIRSEKSLASLSILDETGNSFE